MTLIIDEEEKGVDVNKEIFSASDCYNKDWVSLTNDSQKLNSLACYLCNEILNNAVELHCDEHENAEQVFLIGEKCLEMYLKQNNKKCPSEQHDHCEFSKNKVVRQSVSDLMVICPRQYDLNKDSQSDEGTAKSGEKAEYEKESNSNHSNPKRSCNFKGKIKDVKDHLDKSCRLISIKQVVSVEIQTHLNGINEQLKQLQDVNKDLQSQLQIEKLQTGQQIEKLEKNSNEQSKQIEQLNVTYFVFPNIDYAYNEMQNLRAELLKKDQRINKLTDDFEQFKSNMNREHFELTTRLGQYQTEYNTFGEDDNNEDKDEDDNNEDKDEDDYQDEDNSEEMW
ncbi:viral A-type inclusion protein [Reticulomyxa filosa]|uniref:Viral A-type inclusion protein n=1 Tax=Reticulomyxa filosa TaxID=46433 RepID=X6LYH0_RETFI|nr:viral A-type inclusion protein [Reticulomyxa filosa]|eukprot:ETO06371.1 viral A-type inclusion protein [Reticulomyxa filosa]